jgi:hypothetical protein
MVVGARGAKGVDSIAKFAENDGAKRHEKQNIGVI